MEKSVKRKEGNIMKKIAIITTRFGSFLNYKDLWLLSVAYNSNIDFYLVTDIPIENNEYPPNLHIINTTLEGLRNRIQIFFDFDIVIDRPYKITDYQAAFGLIFKEELIDYDFWGYCDTDVIFGDLRTFFTDGILEENERIYFKDHLTLYRNNQKMRELFMAKSLNALSYKKAFTTPYICYFGEKAMIELTKENNIAYYNNPEYADVLYKYFNFRLATELPNNIPQVFEWNHGRLYKLTVENNCVIKKEYSYVHLQKRNMGIYVDQQEKGFLVVPNMFITKRNLTTEEILKFSKDKLIWRILYYWKHRFIGRLKKVRNDAIKQRLIMYFGKKT